MAEWQYNPDTGDVWDDRMLEPNQAQVSPAPQMQNDWNSYFSSMQPGQSVAWGGGTLIMNSDGTAKYTDPYSVNGGATLTKDQINNPAVIAYLAASSPELARQWESQYGYSSGLNANDIAAIEAQRLQTAPGLHPEWYGPGYTPPAPVEAVIAPTPAPVTQLPAPNPAPTVVPVGAPTGERLLTANFGDLMVDEVAPPPASTGALTTAEAPTGGYWHDDGSGEQYYYDYATGQDYYNGPPTGATAPSGALTTAVTASDPSAVIGAMIARQRANGMTDAVIAALWEGQPLADQFLNGAKADQVALDTYLNPTPAAPVPAPESTGALTTAAPAGYYTTTYGFDGSGGEGGNYVPTQVWHEGVDPNAPKIVANFDPAAMGLTVETEGYRPASLETGEADTTHQIGYFKSLPDGFTQHYGMNGEDLGISRDQTPWESLRPIAAIVGSTFLPGVFNGLLGAGGAGLSGMGLSAGTGALTGATVGAITGGDPIQGALMGGLSGAAFKAVGDYLGPGANGGFSDAQIQQNAGYGAFNNDAVDSMLALENINTGYGAFNNDALDTAAINVNSNPTDVRLLENTQVTPTVSEAVGPLTRTQLDGTTDTAGHAPDALDIKKFNDALDTGASVADAVNYAVNPNAAAPNTTNGLSDTADNVNQGYGANNNDAVDTLAGSPSDPLSEGRTNRGYDGEEVGGTGSSTSTAFPNGTPSVDTQQTIIDKIKDKITGKYIDPKTGEVDWVKVLATAGVAISAGGNIVKALSGEESGSPKTIDELKAGMTKKPPGTATGGGARFGLGLKAGNQLARTYSADMASPLRAGASRGRLQAPEHPGVQRLDPRIMDVLYPAKGRLQVGKQQRLAEGGPVRGALSVAPPFAGFVSGPGGGQQDLIDAKLSAGEYVWDAESVSNLGDGNNAEGARRLDELRQNLRAHKRSAPDDQIAPPAQGALSYMNGGQ